MLQYNMSTGDCFNGWNSFINTDIKPIQIESNNVSATFTLKLFYKKYLYYIFSML